jgi:hypothetical protein
MREPLAVELSWALVAFTIEFDNEAEARLVHWTTAGGRADRPAGATWLVSQVMWSNVLSHLPPEGLPTRELAGRARTNRLTLRGLSRWGYLTVTPEPAGEFVRPSRRGSRAQGVWRPLAGEVEQRWRDRFGAGQVLALREALQHLVNRFDTELPDYLPVVGFGLFTEDDPPVAIPRPEAGQADLSTLLARVLLAFTRQFEAAVPVSLAVAANALRVLSTDPVPVRDLPGLTGVSKEAIQMSLTFLTARGFAVVEPIAGASRGQAARLTAQGAALRERADALVASIEQAWRQRYGAAAIDAVRAALRPFAGSDGGPLLAGTTPYPDGWRAGAPPRLLPHHPAVLHRGGYPDGS